MNEFEKVRQIRKIVQWLEEIGRRILKSLCIFEKERKTENTNKKEKRKRKEQNGEMGVTEHKSCVAPGRYCNSP